MANECPFVCIKENSEIYKSFSVPIKPDKDGKKSVETVSYKM